MKRFGLMAILVALFLSGNVFAQDRLTVSVDSGFSRSGSKHYEVASEDEINKDGTPYFTWKEAITACENSTVDGKTDWVLPEKDVLNAMYEQLHKKGVGVFADGSYWSSSGGGVGIAWLLRFYNGKQNAFDKDLTPARVRCVLAL